jgi:hypothetical protein
MLRIAVLVVLLVAVTLGVPGPGAAQTPSLNWGSEVNPSQCPTDQGYRYLEINVTRDVQFDVAPGAGQVDADQTAPVKPDGWAVREFNQHIQVWKIGVTPGGGDVGTERYCALVRYQGSFVSTGTSDPSGIASLAADVDGTFEGGYRLVFNADEAYTAATRGHIETVAASGGAFDWLPIYFQNVGLRDSSGAIVVTGTPPPAWWGWVYHGGHNGTFVNAVSGVQGNITGAP